MLVPSLRWHNHEVIGVTSLFHFRKFVTQLQNNTLVHNTNSKARANWSWCSVMKWTTSTHFNLIIQSWCRVRNIHAHWWSTYRFNQNNCSHMQTICLILSRRKQNVKMCWSRERELCKMIFFLNAKSILYLNGIGKRYTKSCHWKNYFYLVWFLKVGTKDKTVRATRQTFSNTTEWAESSQMVAGECLGNKDKNV